MWHGISSITPINLTLGRTRKLLDGAPRDFALLQYFETILPSLESLWSSLQDKVYFMGGGAAGGLWRHQQWSQS